jgi:hypothetical protein
VPEAAAVTLRTRDGSTAEAQVRKLLTQLYDTALLERLEGRGPERRFSLHDLQLDHLRAAAQETRLVSASR